MPSPIAEQPGLLLRDPFRYTGDVLVIPPFHAHRVEALGFSLSLSVVTPSREERLWAAAYWQPVPFAGLAIHDPAGPQGGAAQPPPPAAGGARAKAVQRRAYAT